MSELSKNLNISLFKEFSKYWIIKPFKARRRREIKSARAKKEKKKKSWEKILYPEPIKTISESSYSNLKRT